MALFLLFPDLPQLKWLSSFFVNSTFLIYSILLIPGNSLTYKIHQILLGPRRYIRLISLHKKYLAYQSQARPLDFQEGLKLFFANSLFIFSVFFSFLFLFFSIIFPVIFFKFLVFFFIFLAFFFIIHIKPLYLCWFKVILSWLSFTIPRAF